MGVCCDGKENMRKAGEADRVNVNFGKVELIY